MNDFSSINEFFSQIGCHFQCYDMGRLIRPVAQQTLIDFEQNSINWASPFMQHAWLAILFWAPPSTQEATTESNQNHYVWFLKLPLDEQAKLNLVARDDFLRRLIDALSNHVEPSIASSHKNKNTEKLHSLENAMKDNPYGFQPKPEQLANFHAIVHKHLLLPPSQYYRGVQKYLSGVQGFEHWTELGYQGFADIAARLDEDVQNQSNQKLISKALALIPTPPFQALGQCLENHVVSDELVQAVFDRLKSELNNNNNKQSLAIICTAAIHATAQASNPILQIQVLNTILKSAICNDIEVLASISGRCWQRLSDAKILTPFLEALANTEHGQGAFNAILSDLMFIPGMRESILQAFRTPERSESLAQAIGAFFSQLAHHEID